MPEGCKCLGVIRQQLLVSNEIPYTSHNSAACMIAEVSEPSLLDQTVANAVAHIEAHAADGSDPGLCVTTETDSFLEDLITFGHACTCTVSTQKQALKAARNAHLSGHGGTNDGIIGAAAAVGLTIAGWSGRFIELGNLRNYPNEISVAELIQAGIQVVSMERDATLPGPSDIVITNKWLRPRLLGHCPVLLVSPNGNGYWQNLYLKRRKVNRYSEGEKLREAAN
jgi:hypothetical protein